MSNPICCLPVFFNSASDLYQISTLEGHLVAVNQAWRDTLNYQESEVSRLCFFDLVHPQWRDHTQAAFQQVWQTHQDNELETTLLTQAGDSIHVSGCICYQSRKQTGELWCLWRVSDRQQVEESLRQAIVALGLAVQERTIALTETVGQLQHEALTRRHIQDALQESEERYRSIIAALQEGIILHNSQGQVETCNCSAERILGRQVEHMQQQGVFDPAWQIVDANGIPYTEAYYPFQQVLETRKACFQAVMGIHKLDGTLIWLSVNSQPLFRPQETHPYGIVTSFSDITVAKNLEEGRKQAELALRESEARYRAIVEDQTELVCRFQADGTLTFVNDAYCQMIGVSREELLSHQYKMFLIALEPEAGLQLTTPSPESPVRWLEHQVILPNGEVRWHQWNSRAIVDDRGHFIEFQAVGRDISERKKAEEEVVNALRKEKELSQLRSRFVSMVSHEFRTPLTTIQSTAELLEYYNGADPKRAERFQQIYDAVQHMTQLLEDVLFIGRLESGALYTQPSLVNLTDFCQLLIDELEQIHETHQFCFLAQGNGQSAWLDRKLLRQILTNLLSNAIKYSSEGSCVWLSINYFSNQVSLQVRDEGIGIPTRDQERLFEPFHRATNVDGIPGTGLGLAIVKKCVELSHGQISVESTVGAGTTITVMLPLPQM